ncbi:transcriptional activator DEMETER-like [Thalictrum thalictroides]|uniref:Transcriptional activator DEMETER-like n=1 Tax=Thalictrum thalictroides TaxID=46969 RepID=A0A7J6X7V2_THATH|nr:transcriptional activator DEMETER-like [Thalictrum thalictroides]
MDFSRGFLIRNGNELKVQGSWTPVTPAKPIPTRPRATTSGRQENQAARQNWPELSGLPADLIQGNVRNPTWSHGQAAYFNSTICVDHHREPNNWESALVERMEVREPTIGIHTQELSNANAQEGWHNLGFKDLLEKMGGTDNFPFHLPEDDHKQPQFNSSDVLFQGQPYSVSSSRSGINQSAQLHQNKFPVPYGCTTMWDPSSTARPIYDLNYSPQAIGNAASHGNISFQSVPVSPEKSTGLQQKHVSDANMHIQLTSPDSGGRMHHGQPLDAVSNDTSFFTVDNENTSIQFAPVTPAKGSTMQHNQLFLDEGNRVHFTQLLRDFSNGTSVTPEKGSTSQHNQLTELADIFQNGRSQEDAIPNAHNCFELHSQLSCLESVVNSSPAAPEKQSKPTVGSMCDALSTPSKENHQHEKGEDNGIDLNKTPQQKPRKKKYTPKVLKEGKPKRTPKSAVKQTNMKENKTEKRKYVRKKGISTSNTPSTDVVGDIRGGKQCPVTGSCKRALSFDLDGQGNESHEKSARHQEEVNQSNDHLNTAGCTFNPESQVSDQFIINKESDRCTALQFPHGVDKMVERSLPSDAFDLNHSATQMLSEILSPEMASQPTRREVLRKNLTFLGRDEHETRTANEYHNCGWYLPLAGDKRARQTKRAHPQTTDEGSARSFNMIGAQFNSSKVYQEMLQANVDIRNGTIDMLFPEIHKKRRTETTTGKSRLVTVGDGHKEATAHYSNNANTLSTSQWNSSHLCLASSSLSQSQRNSFQHLNADRMSAFGKLKSSESELTSSESELMRTIRQTEMKTRKRSKGHTRVRDFASLTEVTQCNNMQSPLRSTSTLHDRRITEMSQGTQYSMQYPTADNPANKTRNKYGMEGSNRNMVSFSSNNPIRLEEDQSVVYGHRRHSAKSRGSLKVMQQFISPVDELIQKLNCLSMSDENRMISANQENALVPFKGDDRMVPYQGMFDPIKKRKPRPKVNLDSETNRVWMLLMGKEAIESDEADDIKKQKYWEEERRVFSGRADSFIARMHLIQGDRRFTRWQGSVLDSVIGVFLTQNVSDHLSSSAFMSLAARFPPKPTSNDRACREETTKMYVEEPEIAELESGDTRWHDKIATEPIGSQDSQSSVTLYEADRVEDKETDNISESIESNTDGSCSSGVSDKDFSTFQEPSKIKAGIAKADDGRLIEVESSGISSQNSEDSSLFQAIGDTNASEVRATLLEVDNRTLEDVASSQNCGNSFLLKKDEIIRSCSDSNSEEEDPTTRYNSNASNGSTSFMELLHTTMIQGCHTPGIERLTIDLNSETCHNHSESTNLGKSLNLGSIDVENNTCSFQPSSSKFDHIEAPNISSSTYSVQIFSPDAQCQELGEQSRSSLPLTGAIKESSNVANMDRNHPMETSEQNISSDAPATYLGVPYSSFDKLPDHPVIISKRDMCLDNQPNSWGNTQSVESSKFEGDQSSEHEVLNAQAQRCTTRQQVDSNSPKFSGETLEVVESSLLLDKEHLKEDAASGLKEHVHPSKLSHETNNKTPKKPNGKPAKQKKKAVDWDYLRKDAYKNCGKRERKHDTMDSLDWEAVRCADVSEIAKAIKERGMNNMLAERIKAFLDRLVQEHGSIDLEWLRDVPPDKAKEYLLSVRGLGLKSVECVRLLTLHHLAFPVDTNVGRIAVRLGWVPLQPLPGALELHLLEMYPVLETIQKYLWPRLCTLDQRTLYELHYQLITFGKVFCTKSKPNCNACPMRAECKHFASAFASARFALPGPEEKGIVSSNVPAMGNHVPAMGINPLSLPPPEATTPDRINSMPLNPTDANMLSETRTRIENSEPIIEVPASPEPECNEVPECDIGDIEDAFWEEDPDEIPTIKLNLEDFALNLQNYMQENNMKLQDGDMSKALVALSPEAASLPTPKLKNVGRLRTEHLCYELPDDHTLLKLKQVEERVPGEVSPYLLAIWTPGETAESIEPPKACGASQISGNLCCETTCSSCNAIREAYTQTVRGTLLIPCRTAMRGSFPLNGTYFQVNEVFADHESSLNPIDVPRAWIWKLKTRMVYFGTSVSSIFKGQSTNEIQACFWNGYVCVRGFDQRTRAPRPLMARLHFPASKVVASKVVAKAKGKEKGKMDE